MKKHSSINFSNKHKVALLILSFVLITSIFLLCFVNFEAEAEITLSQTEIKAEYAKGTSIDLPNADILVDGEVIDNVKPLVYLPNGKLTSQTSLTLDEIGLYTLEYSTEKEGKRFAKTQEFRVYDYLLANSSTDEPLFYGEYAYKNDLHDTTVEGLTFKLKQGEQISYNKILDLSRSTKDDLLISLEATPLTQTVAEVRDIYVKLTDIYDSTNFLTIRIRKTADENNNNDYAHVAGSYGTESLSYVHGELNWGVGTRNGLAGDWCKSHTAIKIFFDYDSKCLYTIDSSGQKALCVDYENDYLNAWKGFTTGEVFMTIYADSFTSAAVTEPFKGMILGIYNEELNSDLSDDGTVKLNKITQLNAPKIDFGTYLTQDKIPNAMVGFPYEIFPSLQTSIYVESETDIKVYYGYNSSSRFAIPIIDNTFTPITDGVYTIVYRSVDVFGNVGEKFVDVYAQKATSSSFTFNVQVDDEYKDAVVGTERTVSTDFDAEGELGSVSVYIEAKHSDGTVVEVKDSAFYPTKAGEWTVSYTAVDAVKRTGTFSYKVNATVSDKVMFNSAQFSSKYFIVGAKNPIPMLQCVDYNVDGEIKDVDKILAFKGETQVGEITDGFFTPNSAGEYIIKYQSTSAKGVTSDTGNKYTFTAIDVGFDSADFALNNYFYSKTSAITDRKATDTNVTISVKGNEEIEFIRPLDAVNFALKFNVGNGLEKVQSLTIKLVDVYNENQKLEFTFIKTSNGVSLSVNDGKAQNLVDYKLGGGASIALSLNSGRLTLGKNIINISTFVNGDEYLGFSSSLVNFSFNVKTENGNSDIVDVIINEITGQSFSNVDADYIEPRIILKESVSSSNMMGDEMIIKSAVITDVIDTYSLAKLSVISPSGAYLKDVNGIELKGVAIDKDYKITLTEYGKYKIRYEVSDSNNSSTSTISFEVLSREKPKIILEETEIEIDEGDTIDIPKITYESASSKVKVYIYVRGPIGNLKELESDGKNYVTELKFEQVGKHIIRYLLIDEWNNIAYADYTVIVK